MIGRQCGGRTGRGVVRKLNYDVRVHAESRAHVCACVRRVACEFIQEQTTTNTQPRSYKCTALYYE